jgi:predicted enzyme related to lactoylglutathione lyase
MGNSVVHFEIGCRDSEKTAAFYGALFDWTIETHGAARMINTGVSAGIQGHITELGHEPHNYTLVYVHVDDLDACLARAVELGGAVMIGPTGAPGMGHFAWIKDPEGTLVGLWKPAM